MKHLLLSLVLIISANAWADDEFPIELTCELGDAILFIHLNENKEKSWYMPHEFPPNRMGYSLKKGAGKKIPFRFKYTIEEHNILITISMSPISMGIEDRHYINRYSLGMTNVESESGQCYKGFKEYEKQI